MKFLFCILIFFEEPTMLYISSSGQRFQFYLRGFETCEGHRTHFAVTSTGFAYMKGGKIKVKAPSNFRITSEKSVRKHDGYLRRCKAQLTTALQSNLTGTVSYPVLDCACRAWDLLKMAQLHTHTGVSLVNAACPVPTDMPCFWRYN